MKKFKIFLLLSILLCLGFTLSYEVHAQSSGPKVFEIGDVLPATTQLKISWDSELNSFLSLGSEYRIYTLIDTFILVGDEYEEGDNVTFTIYTNTGSIDIYYNGWIPPYTDYSGGHNYIVLDISSWSESMRTIDDADSLDLLDCLYWEDLNAPSGPKPFEVGDELPAGYIKISWDFTGKPIAESATFYISGDYLQIEIWENNNIEVYINDELFYADIPGETVIILTEPSTIYSIGSSSDDYDYDEYVDDALLWEVATEEDFIYSEAYQDGYSDGYFLGYKHAREIYGYYDSTTDEWLSVSEYITRYGNDSPGVSDFYNNFDKYFIPAMIIVFGGAIVLTILKVFKGRE